MGLIKAAMGAAGGVMADQWKEFFYCDALDQDTLMIKGQKRTGARSSNTKGSDNIISNGSGIAVANGQCMMIVEQGKVVEVCAEPGEYTYDTSSEPSIFAGNLSDSIKSTFMTIGKRFTYGGDTGKDQRVYYFNTKEITDNKFGTANPVWFRVVDQKINLDKDVEIRCNGIYSYRITKPLLFYTNLGGNVSDRFERSEIDTQLRTEFINALQPAFAKIAELEIRPSQIPAHSMEIGDAMNEVLTKKWSELRGISIVSVAFNPVTLKEEDAEAIKQAQNASMYRDPNMMAATLGMAQAEAMKTAAGNPNGAMMGFMGMNMAGGGMGGMNLQGLYNQGAAQQQMQQGALYAYNLDGMEIYDFTLYDNLEIPVWNEGGECGGCGDPEGYGAPLEAAGEEPGLIGQWISTELKNQSGQNITYGMYFGDYQYFEFQYGQMGHDLECWSGTFEVTDQFRNGELVVHYVLYTPDGTREGEFYTMVNYGEMLVTEGSGDAIFPFTDASTEWFYSY